MAVPYYTDINKIEMEDLVDTLANFDKYKPMFLVVPIEHYTIDDLKILSQMATAKNLVMSVKYSRSNFYYGVLVQFSKKRNSEDKHHDIWIEEL